MTAGGQQYDPTKFAVSPITGELIAHADMAGEDPENQENRHAHGTMGVICSWK
jgi:hypothetical protein